MYIDLANIYLYNIFANIYHQFVIKDMSTLHRNAANVNVNIPVLELIYLTKMTYISIIYQHE